MSHLEAFRDETRAWLEANLPPGLRGKVGDRDAWPGGGRKAAYKYPESRQWMERAAERGWTAPSWPRQYGGGGHDKDEAQSRCGEEPCSTVLHRCNSPWRFSYVPVRCRLPESTAFAGFVLT